ncbi:alpha/beta fold hydrolase [Deinococcus sp. PEB2-63]
MKRTLTTLTAFLATAALAGGAQGQTVPDRGTVTVNGSTVFYKATGSGQPLLLIHGYPLSGELFKNNRALLARNFRVITVDLPGFGLSRGPNADASIENYATTVLGVMDALNLKQVVAGGMTLLQMYKKAPERFRDLISIDTTADPSDVAEKANWLGTGQQAQEKGVASLVDILMPRMLTGQSRMTMPNQVMHLGSLVKQASLNGAAGGATALANRPDANPILPTIRVPTLYLFGAEDNLTPAEVAMKMQMHTPGSRLVLIPGAGHAATFEMASAAARAMNDFALALR